MDTAAKVAYALEGARDAIARIKPTAEPGDTRGAAEAAFWVAALEDVVSEPMGGIGETSEWAELCKRQPESMRDLLEGLRFVRNHAAHGLVHLVEAHGFTLPYTLPYSIETTLRWQRDDVPPAQRDDNPNRRRHQAYLRVLAGQDVIPSLNRALEFLVECAAL